MSDSLSGIIGEIKHEVGLMASKISKGVASVAYQEMQDAHAEIMNSFYSWYTPVKYYTYYYYKDNTFYSGKAHGYKRTENLKKSLKPIGIFPAGKYGFDAVINIGSDGMSDYVNNTGHTFPASAVFDLIWNQANRGLPPGYRGHIGQVSISAAPAGVSISGSPDEAMNEFIEAWPEIRGPEVSDIIASGV